MKAIDQKADEYAYNEWRDFPEEQAIARKGFKAGAEHVLKLYESGNTSEKEKCELLGIIQAKDALIAELEKENEEMKKGLGCETCQIHLEYKRLNDKIMELEKENEQHRWHNIKDNPQDLPTEDGQYLIYEIQYGDPWYDVAYFVTCANVFGTGHEKVIAWRELPKYEG